MLFRAQVVENANLLVFCGGKGVISSTVSKFKNKHSFDGIVLRLVLKKYIADTLAAAWVKLQLDTQGLLCKD